MDKKQKGLADTGDADFILNESGTSVRIDKSEPENQQFTAEQRDNPPLENDQNNCDCDQ